MAVGNLEICIRSKSGSNPPIHTKEFSARCSLCSLMMKASRLCRRPRNHNHDTIIMRQLVILLLTLSIPLNAQTGKRGVTPEDYYAFKNVTDAQISPDGKTVVYAVTSSDEKRNRRETAIRWMSLDGSGTAQ